MPSCVVELASDVTTELGEDWGGGVVVVPVELGPATSDELVLTAVGSGLRAEFIPS